MSPTPSTIQEQPGSHKMAVLPSEGGRDVEGQCTHHKANRLRGAGAGKDCFLAIFGCFLCFECCEGCCDVIGDIICCPCEMLC